MIHGMSINPVQDGIPQWTRGWRLQRALGHLKETTGEILTAEQFGDELGVSRSTLSRWMNDHGPVRDIYLRQWAFRCGVNFNWLKDGETVRPPGGPSTVAPTRWILSSASMSDLSGYDTLTSLLLPVAA
jgi:transcriptional regulator with XRE-family HTH domain